jgi:hypothetical protein
VGQVNQQMEQFGMAGIQSTQLKSEELRKITLREINNAIQRFSQDFASLSI